MPNLEMCPSTVCSVRTLCERNWDSDIHRPDREYEEQTWVPLKSWGGVDYSKESKPEDCAWFKPLTIEQMMEQGIVWRKFDRAT